MKKKEYISPKTVAIAARHYARILSGSLGASGVDNAEGIKWQVDGFEDDADDR